MLLENQYKLSFYQECANIGDRDNIHLVQHTESKKFYVRKDLQIYNKTVYAAMQEMTSEYFPQIVECIEDGDSLIVIEEYIHGDSLETIYREHGTFPEQVLAGYMIQLCEALRILHAMRPPIIHRDIKPSNVIITNDGRLKLIDINIAKTFEQNESKDTLLIGTKEFAAPEQYGFRQSDARTDIYAIGVMMNYLLSGRFPREYIYQGALTNIIKKCVQLDPDHRIQSAFELERMLVKIKGPKQEYSGNVEVISWKRFLPPGFRSGKIWKMIIAILGYLSMISICVESTFSDQGTPITGVRLIYDRIWAFGIGLIGLLVLTNYLDIQKKLPMYRRDNKILRGIQAVLYCCVSMFVVLCIMVVLEMLLW